ncbi:hypothetical protein CcCBS67573_g00641 [Chytriomyces confervae]|uniref:F-box domain-containing protein n=1 Tax=Chytriomyces confervae TaxID=246404 RepID=A0A507FRC5_9FUNG|nr:hypothetical protein CcCBS67573_g00641 [Chytriomyces confervae]
MEALKFGDIIDTIFQFMDEIDLAECSVVNRVWQNRAERRVWRRIEIRVGTQWDTLKAIVKKRSRNNSNMTQPHVLIRSITLAPGRSSDSVSSTSSVSSSSVAGIARFVASIGTNLKALSVHAPVLGDDHLWAIAAKCTDLHTLSLSCLSGIIETNRQSPSQSPSLLPVSRSLANASTLCISDDAILSIASHCKHLKRLRLCAANPNPLSARAFDAIADAFTNLESFALEWPAGMGSRTTFTMAKEDTMRLARSVARVLETNPNLTVLSVDWHFDRIELDLVLSHAALHLSKLETLRVGGFHSLASIAPVVRNNHNLKTLILVDMMTSTFQDHEIQQFFNDVQPLVTDIEAQTNHSGNVLIPFPLRLENLELDGTGHILSILPFISRFSNLTRMRIRPSRLSASILFEQTDLMICEAIRNLVNLRHVEIPIFGNTPLIALAESCPLLEEVDIIDGSQVTDQALILLVKACGRLHTLHLGIAAHLSDTSIIVLARTCAERLVYITLPFRTKSITVRTLDELQRSCPNLDTLLNIPVCASGLTNGVTKESIMTTIPMMTRLTKVGLCFIGSGTNGLEGMFGLFISRVEMDELKTRSGGRLKNIVVNA